MWAIITIKWATHQLTSQPSLILSTDAETAFDRVDWAFMEELLRFLGLGFRIGGWITLLYQKPGYE